MEVILCNCDPSNGIVDQVVINYVYLYKRATWSMAFFLKKMTKFLCTACFESTSVAAASGDQSWSPC